VSFLWPNPSTLDLQQKKSLHVGIHPSHRTRQALPSPSSMPSERLIFSTAARWCPSPEDFSTGCLFLSPLLSISYVAHLWIFPDAASSPSLPALSSFSLALGRLSPCARLPGWSSLTPRRALWCSLLFQPRHPMALPLCSSARPSLLLAELHGLRPCSDCVQLLSLAVLFPIRSASAFPCLADLGRLPFSLCFSM
jgi:hypothetical protein